MKTKLLKAVTSLTIMGGVLLSTNHSTVKAEETSSVVFHDVPQTHWSYTAIMDLANAGIIAGYGNGVFGFGDDVTREQVARLIYNVYGIEEQIEYSNPYGDINENSTMFMEEILTLTEIGVFSGDENGNFRPKASLTRAEMAQVLTNAFDLLPLEQHTFTDVPTNSWANDAISAVYSYGITSGTGNGKFEPATKVTREQYAQFLHNVLSNMEE
ncbi:S-layer protein [Bacillus manliponensis]|uniref:S-layer protein n=1 Tax=Bacillus manliponensis TaxID=574376 RepID=A0A073K4B3_9BACI|nr:S-layer homology domain-containing protein [Bacillus manliponensis]KEK21335.1 S-layer protein [Bacillus manliponensis]